MGWQFQLSSVGWLFRSPLGSPILPRLWEGSVVLLLAVGWTLGSTSSLVPQQAGPGFAAWWHDPEEECESVPSLPLHGTGQSKSQGQSFFQGRKEFPSLNTLNGRMCKLTLQRAWPEGSVKSRLCFPPIYCFKPGSGRAVCGASTMPSFASADSGPC